MFTLGVVFLFIVIVHGATNKDGVLLKDINVLTLYRDRLTTGRRSAPMAQLTCVGGAAKHLQQQVEIVQCYNKGFDGSSYAWECVTEIDKALKLGEVTVSCEGYHYPDDPQVLVGSCALEYFLEYSVESVKSRQEHPVTSVSRNPKKTTTTTTTTTTKMINSYPPPLTTAQKDTLVSLAWVVFAVCLTVLILGTIFYNPMHPASNYDRGYQQPVDSVTPEPRVRRTVTTAESVTPSYTYPRSTYDPPLPNIVVQEQHPVTVVHHQQLVLPIQQTTYINSNSNNYISSAQRETIVETTTTSSSTTTVDETPFFVSSSSSSSYSTPSSSNTHISKSYGGTKGR